jgi:uncharacterized membrane-anchored protein YhcB (DUF1043 family)
MTTVAAIGYVIGIFIFAIIFRIYKKRSNTRSMADIERKKSIAGKGDKHD